MTRCAHVDHAFCCSAAVVCVAGGEPVSGVRDVTQLSLCIIIHVDIDSPRESQKTIQISGQHFCTHMRLACMFFVVYTNAVRVVRAGLIACGGEPVGGVRDVAQLSLLA